MAKRHSFDPRSWSESVISLYACPRNCGVPAINQKATKCHSGSRISQQLHGWSIASVHNQAHQWCHIGGEVHPHDLGHLRQPNWTKAQRSPRLLLRWYVWTAKSMASSTMFGQPFWPASTSVPRFQWWCCHGCQRKKTAPPQNNRNTLYRKSSCIPLFSIYNFLLNIDLRIVMQCILACWFKCCTDWFMSLLVFGAYLSMLFLFMYTYSVCPSVFFQSKHVGRPLAPAYCLLNKTQDGRNGSQFAHYTTEATKKRSFCSRSEHSHRVPFTLRNSHWDSSYWDIPTETYWDSSHWDSSHWKLFTLRFVHSEICSHWDIHTEMFTKRWFHMFHFSFKFWDQSKGGW